MKTDQFIFENSQVTERNLRPLTPKQELSREKRLKILARFQYQNNMSQEEMRRYFEEMAAENMMKLDEKQEQVKPEEKEETNNPWYYMLKGMGLIKK